MNDGPLSSMTSEVRAMIDAAKADGPGAAARAKVWAGVSSAVGGAAAGAAGAAAGGAAGGGMGGAAAAAGGVSAAKMLAIGTLLGGTFTVGLAVTMLRVGPAPLPLPREELRPASGVSQSSKGSPPAETEGPGAGELAGPAPAPTVPTVAIGDLLAAPAREPRSPRASSPVAGGAAPPRLPGPAIDALAREAQLVSEARGALGRGDPARALQAIRAARALPSHQLAPEELAVEAQALRALGRPGDANDADEKLRSRFPESALAR